MSKFFPGCPVRIVRTHESSRLLGVECRTVRWRDNAWGHISGYFCGWELDVVNKYGCACVAPEAFIEPIQPSGAAPSELSYTELMDRCRAGEGVAA